MAKKTKQVQQAKKLSLNKDKIKIKILTRKNMFQRLTCLNSENVGRLKKDQIYFGIELEHTFKVYSEPNLLNKDGYSTYIGEYAKTRLLNRAKYRDDQIDSIIKED